VADELAPSKEDAMLRSLALGTWVLTLGLGLATGAGGGVSAAMTQPTQFSGDIACTVAGSVGFNPKITDRGAAPEKLTVTLKISRCSGAGATDGGVTLTAGTLRATTTGSFTSACEPIVNASPLPAATGSIRWKGRGGKILASAVTVSSETLFYDTGANTLDLYLGTADVSGGSFDGQHLTFGTLVAKKNPNKTVTMCGYHGIKTVAFGPATTNVGA
jgi:hypothetical protein